MLAVTIPELRPAFPLALTSGLAGVSHVFPISCRGDSAMVLLRACEFNQNRYGKTIAYTTSAGIFNMAMLNNGTTTLNSNARQNTTQINAFAVVSDHGAFDLYTKMIVISRRAAW